MPASGDAVQHQNFYLNEAHELATSDKTGGGRAVQYVGIPWAKKAKRISDSIERVLEEVSESKDPLRAKSYFVVAQPEVALTKRSADKRKAPKGTVTEVTEFGDAHGKIFDRLGLDLLQVTDDGKAVVHGSRERVEQLYQRSKALGSLGAREQSRWATIDLFETVPLELRDAEWLNTLKPRQPTDVVIELQPVLTRVDADIVLRAIADLLLQGEEERLVGTGTDFSGRFWLRGRASLRSVRAIARDYFSVQAIHSPLYSVAEANGRVRRASISASPSRGAPRQMHGSCRASQ